MALHVWNATSLARTFCAMRALRNTPSSDNPDSSTIPVDSFVENLVPPLPEVGQC